jgi:hypothetical protein
MKLVTVRALKDNIRGPDGKRNAVAGNIGIADEEDWNAAFVGDTPTLGVLWQFHKRKQHVPVEVLQRVEFALWCPYSQAWIGIEDGMIFNTAAEAEAAAEGESLCVAEYFHGPWAPPKRYERS